MEHCNSQVWTEQEPEQALALSYLTITYHIAYKTLSHVYFFIILGGVKLAYAVSTTRYIYTCLVSSGMRLRPPPEVV